MVKKILPNNGKKMCKDSVAERARVPDGAKKRARKLEYRAHVREGGKVRM